MDKSKTEALLDSSLPYWRTSLQAMLQELTQSSN
jgi:hypothetical protein